MSNKEFYDSWKQEHIDNPEFTKAEQTLTKIPDDEVLVLKNEDRLIAVTHGSPSYIHHEYFLHFSHNNTYDMDDQARKCLLLRMRNLDHLHNYHISLFPSHDPRQQ